MARHQSRHLSSLKERAGYFPETKVGVVQSSGRTKAQLDRPAAQRGSPQSCLASKLYFITKPICSSNLPKIAQYAKLMFASPTDHYRPTRKFILFFLKAFVIRIVTIRPCIKRNSVHLIPLLFHLCWIRFKRKK